MAVIVDSLASQFAETVASLMKDEVTKIVGAEDELNKLREKLNVLLEVLVDAEKKAFHNPSIRRWLAKLKNVIYDADDVIDYYRIHAERLAGLPALQQSPSTSMVRCSPALASCFHRLVLRHKIGGRVRGINARLEEIIKEKNDFQLTTITPSDRYGSSRSRRETDPLVEPHIVGVGIENDTQDLVRQLTMSGGPPFSVFAIVGIGGIGKTTLAQKIYNHEAVKRTFQEPPPIWVYVSKEYSETNLLSEIIRLAKGNPGGARTVGELQLILTQVLERKKFFLILDDVWDVRIWEGCLNKSLLSGATGSRILITTRNEWVARKMGVVSPHRIQPLSPEDSWLLICKIVFRKGEEEEIQLLRDLGMEIVKKCHGLPLAIMSIAGVLESKDKRRPEWQRVLNNPAWSMTDLPEGVMGVLYLSYEDLPFQLKQCFVFCSLFPEDHVFLRHKLIQLWVAEGFVEEKKGSIMEDVAREYYQELLRRNLLQQDPRYYDDGGCKMHDLLRSLAQFLAQDENLVGDIEALNEASSPSPSSSSSSSSSFVKLRHLSVADSFLEEFPTALKDHESLRTLLFSIFLVMFLLPDDLFKKLKRLRVMDFSGTNIMNLPESIGNLIHLRYLDVSNTLLDELPENIGNLSNLQYLIIQRCEDLESLPKGIARLYKLRSLDLHKTPVDGLPAGIGRLQRLNRLIGFVTNEGGDGNTEWCSLEELRSLSELRTLTIEKLERAVVGSNGGGSILEDKKHLRHLELSCKAHGEQHGVEGQKRIKVVFEELLSPPDSLEKFEIKGYFGLEYPSWLIGNGVSKLFSNLRRLDLNKCRNCRQLPPLGRLPLLDLLTITEALAVQSIGPDFMGWDGENTRAFPRLKTLCLQTLPNWTEWIWEASDAVAFPRLEAMLLSDCHSLRSLPLGILRHATALTTLGIQGAHSMSMIDGLVSLKELTIVLSLSLVRISNLPALVILKIVGCPALRDVDCFRSLRILELVDLEMDSLPEWLLPRSGETQPPFPALERLTITVSRADVLRRCLKDGPDWPKIQHYPHAYIQTPPTGEYDEFGREKQPEYVSFISDPFTLSTNLGDATGDDA